MTTPCLAVATLLALCLAAGGCATVVPSFDVPTDQHGNPTVRSIVDEITCELNEMLAVEPYRGFLLAGNMEAAFQLSLTVNDTGGLAPSLTFTNGVYSLGGSGTYSRSREQNHTQMLYYSMRQLERDNKAAAAAGTPGACARVADTNLAGDLGLRRSVGIAIQSPNLQDSAKLSGTSGEFGGYINFVVTKNLSNVGPTWTLANFKGPGGLFSASEINTDKLTFAFARGLDVADPDLRIRVPRERAKQQINDINLNQLTSQLTILNGNVRVVP